MGAPKTANRVSRVAKRFASVARFLLTPGGKPVRSDRMRQIAGRDTVVWSRYFAPYIVVDLVLFTESIGIDPETRSGALSAAIVGVFVSFFAMVSSYSMHNITIDRVHAYNRGDLPDLVDDPSTLLRSGLPLLLAERLRNLVAFVCTGQLCLAFAHFFPSVPIWVALLLAVPAWLMVRAADKSHHLNSLRSASRTR